MLRFKDRVDAGKKLSAFLKKYANNPDIVVIGLTRGGVVVATEVAKALHVSADAMVVRKICAPIEVELAIGAVTAHGATAFHPMIIRQLQVSDDYLHTSLVRQKQECRQREQLYRSHYPALNLKDKVVVLIDDGIATGMSMEAAIKDVREQKPRRVVVAVPVMPADMVDQLKSVSDELIYVVAPDHFLAIGAFYQDFTQVTNEEVIAALKDTIKNRTDNWQPGS